MDPEEQADPPEQATPSMSRLIMIKSEIEFFGKLTLRIEFKLKSKYSLRPLKIKF